MDDGVGSASAPKELAGVAPVRVLLQCPLCRVDLLLSYITTSPCQTGRELLSTHCCDLVLTQLLPNSCLIEM